MPQKQKIAVEEKVRIVRDCLSQKISISEGARRAGANKLRQMQVPAFASNTKGAWVLRFDDILANALELGPLQSRDFELPEETIQRIGRRGSNTYRL